MQFPQDQIDELKQISPNLRVAEEGGYSYFFLESHPMPEGCSPANIDLLLCPRRKNGYSSILYFAVRLTGGPPRNWNGNIHALSRNWHSFSWQTQPGHTLLQMVQIHLNALKK